MKKINVRDVVEDPWASPKGKYGNIGKMVLVVADNPMGESCHYPDSDKWLVRSPGRRLIRSVPLDYFDREE